MHLHKFIFVAAFALLFSAVSFAQTDSRVKNTQVFSKSSVAQAVKSSPAYAELLLRKTESQARLEELLIDYTDEFPKVQELKFELSLLEKQIEKVSAVGSNDAPKLSLALGKLLVRKTDLEVEQWSLLKQYNADHPDVKRARRKIEIYDKAIKEILP